MFKEKIMNEPSFEVVVSMNLWMHVGQDIYRLVEGESGFHAYHGKSSLKLFRIIKVSEKFITFIG